MRWTRSLSASLLFLAFSHHSAPPTAADAAQLDVSFQYEANRGAIVLELMVDRRPATVLLDTGAARTVLSTAFMRLPNATAGAGHFSSGRPGLTGEGVWARAALSLGGRSLGRMPVRLMDLAEVSQVYERRVDGLLGQDVLTRFDTVEIDFRTRRLRLSGPSAPMP